MAMKMIKQKTQTDCGVAAVAILLEMDYADVWSRINPELQAQILEKGMQRNDIHTVIEGCGLVYDVDFTKRIYGPHWGTLGATRNLLWGRRAIVQAWSKNDVGGCHYIVFDGTNGDEKTLDPSTRLTYDDWNEVEPHEMILLSEAGLMKVRLRKAVNRFLGWKLPQTFSPDCYVSIDCSRADFSKPGFWPVGTNLLTAEEAKQMITYCLEL